MRSEPRRARPQVSVHDRISSPLSALVLLFALALAALCVRPLAAQAPGAGALAIIHASVVDVERGRILSDQTVVVSGERIIALGPSSRIRTPRAARVVDAHGGYLIPGLWDMHVHTDSAMRVLPLFVANGVTGVRVMSGTPADLRARRQIERGERLGPRMVVGTPILDGPKPVFPAGIVVIESPERAAEIADSLHAESYDFLKVYAALPRETFATLAARARQIGMPFVGHLPIAVSLADAVAAGQASFEHLIGLQLACSRDEALLRRGLWEGYERATTTEERIVAMLAENYRPVATYDAARCEGVARDLARARAWQVPTLVTYAAFAAPADSAKWADPNLRYLPQSLRDEQREIIGILPVDSIRLGYERALPLVGLLNRAGVPLLAGTDAPAFYLVPGFSLHDELGVLVRAGLTPLEALRSATLNPALFLGAADSLGSIAPGKRADLVLLDGDPLTDIANTRRIRSVLIRGHYLDRAALDGILFDAERDARH